VTIGAERGGISESGDIRRAAPLLAACLALTSAPAGAQRPEKPEGLFDRETLTGDWGGLRATLSDRGFTFGAT